MKHFNPMLITRYTLMTALADWARENGFQLATDKRGHLRLVPRSGTLSKRSAA